MSELERTLFLLASLLEQHGYQYAVMGGLAVRVHSIPRPTHDVDLTVSIDRSDVSDADQLARVLSDCSAAYYLVHSMQVSGRAYAEQDRTLAKDAISASNLGEAS